MERFVYKPRYVKLLIGMMDSTSTVDELAKKNDINAGHLRTVLDQWTREEVVKKEKTSKEYSLGLTPKGKAIATKLGELLKIVHEYKPPEDKKDEPTKSEPLQSREQHSAKRV